MEKVLIISPHMDDMLFGAFSFLKGSDVYIASYDESRLYVDRPKEEVIKKEIDKIYKSMNLESMMIGEIPVNEYHLEKHWLINSIEMCIDGKKPDVILIPHPSYNQDHQTIYEACMVALRPHDKNHWVPKVLVYDVYDYTNWGENQMSMNFFKEVDIKAKIKAYKKMKSQVRSYRSPDDLKRWAETVGKKCEMKYSEGFRVLRWC